jgi:hypothetical protein
MDAWHWCRALVERPDDMMMLFADTYERGWHAVARAEMRWLRAGAATAGGGGGQGQVGAADAHGGAVQAAAVRPWGGARVIGLASIVDMQ